MQPSLWEPTTAERRAALAVGSITGPQATSVNGQSTGLHAQWAWLVSFLPCASEPWLLRSEPLLCTIWAGRQPLALTPLHKATLIISVAIPIFCLPISFAICAFYQQHALVAVTAHPFGKQKQLWAWNQMGLKVQHSSFLVIWAFISSAKVGDNCRSWRVESVWIYFLKVLTLRSDWPAFPVTSCMYLKLLEHINEYQWPPQQEQHLSWGSQGVGWARACVSFPHHK